MSARILLGQYIREKIGVIFQVFRPRTFARCTIISMSRTLIRFEFEWEQTALNAHPSGKIGVVILKDVLLMPTILHLRSSSTSFHFHNLLKERKEWFLIRTNKPESDSFELPALARDKLNVPPSNSGVWLDIIVTFFSVVGSLSGELYTCLQ